MNNLKKNSSINKKSIIDALNNIKFSKNTIIALYKISDSNGNTLIYNISYINSGKTTHVCPSGSMKSTGGEYRNGILNWSNFNAVLDNPKNSRLKEMYTDIQKYLKSVLVERKLNFTIEYPNFVGKLDLTQINYIKIFAITWFNFYYELALNQHSNKLNSEFITIMKMYVKDDLAAFKGILNKFTQDSIIFRYMCSNAIHSPKITSHDQIKLGQKITILYELELQNINDIRYDIWKEIAINERVTKLVTDAITNGFPLMGAHFLIKTDKIIKLFDNQDQYKKVKQSEIATTVKHLLEEALSKLNTPINLSLKKNKKNISNFINYTVTKDSMYAQDYTQEDEFWLLRNNIQHNKNHSENFIISNTAITMISEHLGRTIYDMCSDINGSHLFSDEQFPNFNKYMFELCYNLYCLNTKVHSIHRDLHMNNIIISPSLNDNIEVDIKDPKILFIVGDKKFIFPNNFHNLCLIDFNISIINPELFMKRGDNDMEDVLDIQVENLLHYLYSIKPEYEEYDQFLKGNAKYYFESYFKILSVLDIYNICYKLLSFLKMNKKKLKSVHHGKSKSLLEAMLKLSDYYISIIFDELINTNNYIKFQKMEWPILSIINSIFQENMYKSADSKSKDASITDTFKF